MSNLPAGEVIVRAGSAKIHPVAQLHDRSEPFVRIVVGQPGNLLARVSETSALRKDGLWMALRADGESRTQRRVKLESSRLAGLVARMQGLAFGAYEVGLETSDPAPPCDWMRIGAPQKVVLDAEHPTVEINLQP